MRSLPLTDGASPYRYGLALTEDELLYLTELTRADSINGDIYVVLSSARAGRFGDILMNEVRTGAPKRIVR